jgi:hypothetical protein
MPGSVYVLNISAAVLSIVYWFLLVTRGDPWARMRAGKAFGVNIVISSHGLWRVLGAPSALGALGIELLQPALYLVAFVVWGGLIMAVVVASSFLERR